MFEKKKKKKRTLDSFYAAHVDAKPIKVCITLQMTIRPGMFRQYYHMHLEESTVPGQPGTMIIKLTQKFFRENAVLASLMMWQMQIECGEAFGDRVIFLEVNDTMTEVICELHRYEPPEN